MKALFINGSPRKNWNTHKMLEQAMQGAADAGAETELIHLYNLNFKGCVSCFACKIKNSKTNGLCAYRDELTPVLQKSINSDVLVIGSPIYLGFSTGMTRSFIERFLFAAMPYSTDKDGKRANVLGKTIYTGMIFTMNCTEDQAKKLNYPVITDVNSFGFKIVFGNCETLCAYNTYQFSDYSRYDANLFDEAEKREHREKVFPEDLQKAYDLGKRLTEKAKQ